MKKLLIKIFGTVMALAIAMMPITSFASDFLCYVGNDEDTGVKYASLDEGIRAASGGIVHLLSDAVLEPTNNSYLNTDVTIDLESFTVTVKKNIYVNTGSCFTIANGTFDISGWHMVANSDGEIILADGAIIKNGSSSTGGAISVSAGGKAVMQGGSKIEKCTATYSGGAFLVQGTLEISGGTITGCKATSGGAIRVQDNGTLKLSGDADITGNFLTDGKTENNIVLAKDASNFILTGEFTGSAGIAGEVGTPFGEAVDYISGAENIHLDPSGKIILSVNDEDKLIFVRDEECYINDNSDKLLSLEEAAENAVSGDIIRLIKDIELLSNLTFSGDKEIAISGEGYTVTSNGGSFVIANKMKLTLTDITIDLADAKSISLSGESALTIGENARITRAFGQNGAVAVIGTGCTVTLSGGTVDNCNANYGGGAFHVNGGTLNLVSGTIKDCQALNGGAVYGASGDITLSGTVVVTDNKKTGDIKNNIYLSNAVLKLVGNFSGSVCVTGTENTAGTVFGEAQEGVTGAENIISDINSAMFGKIKNGALAWAKDGVCYISDNPEELLSLEEAAENAVNGDIIHLTKDIELLSNLALSGDKEIVISGEGYTVTSNGGSLVITDKMKLTLTDITIDLADAKSISLSGEGALTIGENARITRAFGQNGAVAVIGAGCRVTLSGGTVDNCNANYGGGAFHVNGGTLNLVSGTIKDCQALNGGAVYGASGDIILSGTAVVTDNKKTGDIKNNIYISAAVRLKVKGDFSGSAGVTSTSQKVNTVFASAENATGAENIICDTNEALHGFITGDNISWVPGRLAISTKTDSGIRTAQGGEIRFITVFNLIDAEISAIGTYILPASIFTESQPQIYDEPEKVLKTSFAAAHSGEAVFSEALTKGNYCVDIVAIPEEAEDEEFIAISFIKIGSDYIFIPFDMVTVAKKILD